MPPQRTGNGVDPPQKRAFVWPPRRSPAGPESTSTAVSRIQGRAVHGPQEKPTPASVPVQALDFPKSRGHRASSAWSEIERTWLDVTAPPLAQRMAQEYWSPDAPAEYCRRCGLSVERHARADDGQCSDCRHGETPRPPWQRLIRLGEYEAPLSQWIGEVKFTRWRKLGRDLGRVLGDSVLAEMERRTPGRRGDSLKARL